MPLEIRPLLEADIDAVVALEAESFPEPWSEGMLREELAALGRRYLVVVLDGDVVGYGGVMVVDTDAHIMTIAVTAIRRRAGIGSRLMLALIDAALDAGALHLTLELRVSNQAARSLYEKFGFASVGIRPRYYPDEDALVMWALDASGAEYRATLDRIRQEAA
jgi:ribosomal-protein-alanine N-acetyltransferase